MHAVHRLRCAGRACRSLPVALRAGFSTAPRVRFAPSPTGHLHLGGLRTALFNFLFARRHGGQLLLRIEDTDQTRLVDGSVDQIIQSLAWAGVEFDEGPGKPSDVGPFFQSERLHLYREAADQLVAEGHAYPCFCTSERLQALRESQTARGLATMYDRACASLTPAEAAARVAGGEEHVIRMRVPAGSSTVRDAVVGQVTFPHAAVDDQVLLKSDGWPTYHLACVVDDAAMRVSHVIRGQEWLSSTPKHQLLHAALGTPCPEWVHLPLLVNPDRTKLSKRQGHVSVSDFQAAGALPDALANFVAFLGWHGGEGATKEVFTMSELQSAFSLDGLNKANCVVDREKLAWFNAQHLRRQLQAAEPQLPQLTSMLHGDTPLPEAAVPPHDVFVEVARTALPAISARVQEALASGLATPLAWAPPAIPPVQDVRAAALDGSLTFASTVQLGPATPRWADVVAAFMLHHERVSLCPDFADLAWCMFCRPNLQHAELAALFEDVSTPQTQTLLSELLTAFQTLPDADWLGSDASAPLAELKRICKAAKAKQSACMKPLRVVLTGMDRGSAMADLLRVLGKAEVCARLAAALEGAAAVHR